MEIESSFPEKGAGVKERNWNKEKKRK